MYAIYDSSLFIVDHDSFWSHEILTHTISEYILYNC